jgi:hypothetical protein
MIPLGGPDLFGDEAAEMEDESFASSSVGQPDASVFASSARFDARRIIRAQTRSPFPGDRCALA